MSSAPAIRGLWIVSTQDVRRIGTVMALDGLDRAVIGRSNDVTFPLDDEWISRRHLEVERQADGWVARDLGTSNGTLHNGVRLATQPLRDGDVIRLGGTLMCYGAGIITAGTLGLLGLSETLHRVREQLVQLRHGVSVVYVTGESGAGKELVARAIHAESGRTGQLLTINMATIVVGLAESQLFGHRRGAFSGAAADQPGAFDVARNGTLVLDEVAELAPDLQAKLLRAVQFGEVHRIGDRSPHPVDVQLVATTHRDLAAMVRDGTFREDLYWRLATAQIEVPPLRDRRLDVGPLVSHFLGQFATPTFGELIKAQPALAWHTAALLERALLHGWPGNVRELRDETQHLSRAIARRLESTPDAPIPPFEEAFTARFRAAQPLQSSQPPRPAALTLTADELEALLAQPDALRSAIALHTGGNVRRFAEGAALQLGVNVEAVRRRIYRRLTDS